MSKSSKKQAERLKDSVHRERIRSSRHQVRQVIEQSIKQQRLEDLEIVEVNISSKEKDS